MPHPGDEGRKSAHDGDEAGDDDGFAAVFGIEGFGAVQIFAAEKARVGIGEEAVAEVFADGKVGGVSEDGSGDEQRHHQVNVHLAERGNAAGGEKQRIAGQDGGDDKAGLAEDDKEEDGVDERAVAGADLAEVTVDVQDKIKDGAECAACMQDKDKGEEDGGGASGEGKVFFVHDETGERDGAAV
ncbi:hypothetical protein HMPREF9080_00442 [Cardiobacterium valvarum F0432]|uniref:Uncharacterized protein n=1 Tax=Cardiobacterium valvarum F0432 TaxID=797473 RepID=G9ZCG5_9GAMM|nr:hypothetical protein HMPREF9080_00442 [Cardiobacterium valvarum F0432]